MKKGICILVLGAMLCSCGTITQLGKVTPCQKAQQKGETKRKYRVGLIVLDFCLGVVPLAVDIATGAIYKKETPCTVQPSK